MINIDTFSFDNSRFLNLLQRKNSIPNEVVEKVKNILETVKAHGDDALYAYMKEFDNVDIPQIGLFVTKDEFDYAKNTVSETFKEAVKRACENLMKFHINQKQKAYTTAYDNGAVLERKYTPIQCVAVTVPGHMAPLLSSLCMNLIPAIVAGVPDIYVLTKPKEDGTIDSHLLYIADYLGVKNFYKISGAQGIAAVAYGTKTVRKVDAIVGPGNNYTQTAKKHLFGEVRIDSLAGPSEIAIIADENANPRFIAADMLSQAEHGTGYEACTTFCLSHKKAESIKVEIASLMEENNLVKSTEKSLNNYGDIFVVESLEDAVKAVNMIAPEHVEVLIDEPDEILDKIVNAGAIFVGEYSTEPVGDYFCGTNHVLPTCGTARFSSGLSVQDFTRGYSIIRYTKEALLENADYIIDLAKTEGMIAHAMAVEVRKNKE